MKLLVCGTRKKGYEQLVYDKLYLVKPKITEIIEGCCSDSADAYAEEWAKENGIKLDHHPSTQGNYLKRNIEMVEKCDSVIAFWDGYSYGTAHTIAQATMRNIPVIIIKLEGVK